MRVQISSPLRRLQEKLAARRWRKTAARPITEAERERLRADMDKLPRRKLNRDQ